MTKHLEKAIVEMRALPEAEREALSEFVLQMIAERNFDKLLESDASIRVLEKMAEAALAEHRRGETIDIDEICR